MNNQIRQKDPTFGTAKEGQAALLCQFESWSEGLSKYSMQATYAIIGANWAAHGKEILSVTSSLWSIGVCVGFISLSILSTGIMTEWLLSRWNKAEKNPGWWEKEFEKQQRSKFPYTEGIECLGFCLRLLKMSSPILAGTLFLASLL